LYAEESAEIRVSSRRKNTKILADGTLVFLIPIGQKSGTCPYTSKRIVANQACNCILIDTSKVAQNYSEIVFVDNLCHISKPGVESVDTCHSASSSSSFDIDSIPKCINLANNSDGAYDYVATRVGVSNRYVISDNAIGSHGAIEVATTGTKIVTTKVCGVTTQSNVAVNVEPAV